MAVDTTTVEGVVYTPDGQPSGHARLTFQLTDLDVDTDAGAVVTTDRLQVRTDADGQFSVDLWANASGAGGGTRYEVFIQHRNAPSHSTTIYVPESSSPVQFQNLIDYEVEGSPEIVGLLENIQEKLSEADSVVGTVEDKAEKVDVKHGDVESWHGEVKDRHGDVETKHDDVKGWYEDVEAKHEDIETWHGEILDAKEVVDDIDVDKLEEAAETAQNAVDDVEQYKNDAEEARDDAEEARSKAEDYESTARDHRNAAQGYRDEAENYAELAADNSRLEAGDAEKLHWDEDPYVEIKGDPGDQILNLGVPQGPIGPEGPIGPPGPPGVRAALNLRGVVDSEDDLPDSADDGDAYLIDEQIYIYSNGEWVQSLEFSGDLVTQPYVRQIYVSAEAGDDNEHDGRSPRQPFKTIGRALAEARMIQAELDTSDMVHANTPIVAVAVYPGTYQEDHKAMYQTEELPDDEHAKAVARYGILEVPENTGVYSIAGQYMTDVMPKPDGVNFNDGDGESGKPLRNLNLFLCQQSTFIQGFTIRGQEIDDMEDPNGGFAVALSPGKSINRSPYVRDIAQVSNYEALRNPAPPQPHVNDPFPNPAVGKGAGTLLVDRKITPPDTMFPYMLGFAATTRSPNGMAYVAKNGGGLNTIATVTLFAQTHFYAIRGGHLTLNTTGTQFGDITLRASDTMQVVHPYRFDASVPEVRLAGEMQDDELPESIQAIRNAALASEASFLDVQQAKMDEIDQYTGPLVHDYFEWLKDHDTYGELPWDDPYIKYICHRDGMIFLQTLENTLLTGIDFSARTFVLFLFSYRPEDKWRDNIQYQEGDIVNDLGQWYKALKDVRGGDRPSDSDDWEAVPEDEKPPVMLPESEGQVQYVFEGSEYDPQLMIDAFRAAYDFMLERLFGDREPHNSDNTFTGTISDEDHRTMLEFTVDRVINDTLDSPRLMTFGSLCESLGHQFNSAGAGVNHHALPVNMRRSGWHRNVNQTIVEDRGGRVRFNGSDEMNNQYLARDVRIDGRTGRFEGRAFQATVRQIARRIANSRGSF